MKSGKIIFVTYALMLMAILVINDFFSFSVAWYNIFIATVFLTWGIREAWLWHKTDAPSIFRGLTIIGASLVMTHFLIIVTQEVLFAIDIYKTLDDINLHWIYIFPTIFALWYIWKYGLKSK